ncbi:hypothetical protein H4582DRAFT_2125661 [Lactarius indigo]|nr:hypothetical protein H4582DRAFT_2125661 [Lactarius indigo]
MCRKLGKCLADIPGLLDRLDASMLSRARAVPSYYVTPVPVRHSKTRAANGLMPCTTPTRHVGSSLTGGAEASAAAADVDLLLGSAGVGSRLQPARARRGATWRNAEHFSGALAADQGVLHAAEKVHMRGNGGWPLAS